MEIDIGCLPENVSEYDKAEVAAHTVIGAAIEVHRTLGPGLMESTYLRCLCKELDLRGVSYKKEFTVPIFYKGEELEEHYRMDLMVEGVVVVELKTVAAFLPVHQAQVLTYLRLTNRRLGLLINFHTPVLAKGIKRLVNG